MTDKFFKNNCLEWSKLVGCPTDRASAMLGRKSEFQSYITAVLPEIIFSHYFIHIFAFCVKVLLSCTTLVLPTELLSCLLQIIKIINIVKTTALNSFFVLGSDH